MLNEIQQKYLSHINAGFYTALFQEPSHEQSELRKMIRYHYDTGGKRIRPLCVALAAESYWRQTDVQVTEEMALERVLPFAIAVEMIHNATLIHDDLQDGDEFRRSQPTLWKKYSPEQAINCGDLLFFTAMRLVSAGPYTYEMKSSLIDLLVRQTEIVIEGQGEEFRLKQNLQEHGMRPTVSDYESMVLGKTGALFAMPLLGGAIIAGADSKSQNRLRGGAAALGYAFQIQDDYIDIWGDKGRDTKGTDIAEGKLSFPVIQCLSSANDSETATDVVERFVQIIAKTRNETSLADVEWAIQFMESRQVRERTCQQFNSLIADFSEAAEWSNLLGELADRFSHKMR